MNIGIPIPRTDSMDKVLGRPLFAGDIYPRDALHAAVVRSTRPHARVRSVDIRRSLETPGVVKILSARDIPGENLFGAIRKDQPFLAGEIVRYAGEPLLVVVAETDRQAREGADRVRIGYDDLDVLIDPVTTSRSPASIRDEGNLLSMRRVVKGDALRALKDCDVVVENTYRTGWLDHAFLETEAGFGYQDERGRIVVVSSTQNIHYKMKEISRLLAMPEDRIRVIQATTGGGFGGKLDVTVEGFIALAVYHTGRPVVMRFSREESFLSNTKRHPLYVEYRTGAKKDGSILAVDVSIVGDTGPYASYGETVCLRAAIHATGPYEVPHVSVESRMYYTNNPVSGAMRGFGIPQLAFAHESQMDEVAKALNMDPFDIRMKNGLRKGSLTATSQVLEASAGFIDTLKAVEPFWRGRKKDHGEQGFGLGCMFYGCGNTGISNPSSAYITVQGDGRIALHTGVCEIGQGSDTILVQIVQETVGCGKDDIVLVRGDTDTSRDAGSSSASRQTYISGKAVQRAAENLRIYLDKKGFPGGDKLTDVCRRDKDLPSLVFDGYFDPPAGTVDPVTSQGSPYGTYAFATHLSEVNVEEITGICSVKRVYAAHDVGRAINVHNIKGQICGGVAMGIGFALMEEFVPGRTESLDTYYLPTSADMPEIEALIIENHEPTGPFGAKGVGEPALIPQAASIVNAICDATGVRPFRLPVDMERLKELLGKKRE